VSVDDIEFAPGLDFHQTPAAVLDVPRADDLDLDDISLEPITAGPTWAEVGERIPLDPDQFAENVVPIRRGDVVRPGAAGVTDDAARIEWHRLSAVDMRSIVFVDKPLLQAEAFHLVAGRKGMGKGTLLSDIASRVTRGELGEKRNVVWIGSEDSEAIDIKPRILAAAGDPERVLVVKRGWVQLPRDIDEIGKAINDMRDVGMLVVDPLGNHIRGKEGNSETDIRDAIAPLNQTADEHKLMLFGVRHLIYFPRINAPAPRGL
jgi:hypothetical protein